jgi:hypothetical protein
MSKGEKYCIEVFCALKSLKCVLVMRISSLSLKRKVSLSFFNLKESVGGLPLPKVLKNVTDHMFSI